MATTARESLSQLLLLKLMLNQDIIIMVTLMVMATMVTTARERLSQDIIIMVTVMVDMAITVMDTMVNKQHLFISLQHSVTFIGTCWNLVNRNTHFEKIQNSFSEIKK